MVQMISQANPGISPGVLAQAVTAALPFMQMDSKVEWQAAHINYLQDQLRQRGQIAEQKDATTQRGQDIRLHGQELQAATAQAKLEAGERARQMTDARVRDLAQMKDDQIRDIAGDRQETQIQLEGMREAAREEAQKRGIAAKHEDVATTETGKGERLAATEAGKGERLATTEAGKGERLATTEAGKGERLATTEAGKGERLATTEAGKGTRQETAIAARAADTQAKLDAAMARLERGGEIKTKLQGMREEFKEKLTDVIEGHKDIRAQENADLRRELVRLGITAKDLALDKAISGRAALGARTEAGRMERFNIAEANKKEKQMSDQQFKAHENELNRQNRIEVKKTGNPMITGPNGYEMTERDQDQALAIYQYHKPPILPARGGKITPQGEAIMDAVNKLGEKYGTYDAQNYNVRGAGLRDMFAGKSAATMRSIRVADYHLDTYTQLMEALKNNNATLANTIANNWARATGKPEPGNVDAAKQIIAAEVIKAVSGASGGGVKERLEAAGNLSADIGPKRALGIAKTYRSLLDGQKQGFREQYSAIPGNKAEDFDKAFPVHKPDSGAGAAPVAPAGGGGWKIEEVTPQAPKLGG
jgi:hypothetical protein